MAREIKSEAKLKVIDFIRYYSSKDSEKKPPFTFEIRGTRNDAEAFVHRMRVELSRMRQLVRDRGRAPRPFKMMLHDIKTSGIVHNKQMIQLKKDDGAIPIAKEIDEIFSEIAGGALIK
jgi:hypothetical protein